MERPVSLRQKNKLLAVKQDKPLGKYAQNKTPAPIDIAKAVTAGNIGGNLR